MSKKRGRGLGVDWFLPGGKRRIAESTVATSLLLGMLAEDGLTFAEAETALRYDPDGRVVARAFIDRGYGDTPMRDLGVRP